MSEWETFCDESYYHLWRVRRKNDRNFYDGFHVQDGKEATALVELLNGLERERDEAREALVRSNHFLQQAEENLESVYKERNEALKEVEHWKDMYRTVSTF